MGRSLASRALGLALQAARRENLAAVGQPLPVAKDRVGYTRRRLMHRAAVTVGSAIAAGPAVSAPKWSATQAPRIVVVGAGLAGLNAAYQLRKRGLHATIYEGRSRIGGRVLSVTGAVEPGLVDDLGGSFINTDHADLLRLVKEFGLELFDRAADAKRRGLPETAYIFDGRLIPERELAHAMRPLAARITRDADLIDADYDRYAPHFDRLSIAQYLDQVQDLIGAPYVRSLIEQTAHTEFGVEPSETSALQLLFLLPTVTGHRVDVLSYSDELYTVKGGSGRIVAGLAAALAGQVRTRRKLTAVHKARQGYLVHFAGEHGAELVQADFLVLAIPFSTLRDVDLRVPLPGLLRRSIDEVNLGRDEKVLVGFRGRPWQRGDGFVLDLWSNAGFAVAWESTQRQPHQANSVLNFLPGGAQVDAAFAGDPATIGRRFVDVLEQALPGCKARATGRVLRTDWHQQPFTRGGYTNFTPGQYTLFAPHRYLESDEPSERQEVRAGDILFAGEHLSDEYFGFMNGAAQTGRLAAASILHSIR